MVGAADQLAAGQRLFQDGDGVPGRPVATRARPSETLATMAPG